MTVYAPSDVDSITIPDGCGEAHSSPPGVQLAVECPQCEPIIMSRRWGWAHTPTGVAMTPDERRVVEEEEARAARQQSRTWASGPAALGEAFAAAMSAALPGAPASAAPSLLEQIAALSPQERSALAAMLTGGGEQAAPAEEPATPVKEPAEATPPSGDEEPADTLVAAADASGSTAARRGRPRKADLV